MFLKGFLGFFIGCLMGFIGFLMGFYFLSG